MFYSQLFQRDRTRTPNPHELLRIFRFPTSEGREIARAAEKIEQTLNIVRTHVESGMVFNLSCKYFRDSNAVVFILLPHGDAYYIFHANCCLINASTILGCSHLIVHVGIISEFSCSDFFSPQLSLSEKNAQIYLLHT